MSEKYDGIRAYWNGYKMFTRQGKEIRIPEFFKMRMPTFALDGELWYQNQINLKNFLKIEKLKKNLLQIYTRNININKKGLKGVYNKVH